MTNSELNEKIDVLKQEFKTAIQIDIEKQLEEYNAKVLNIHEAERDLRIVYSFILEDGYSEEQIGFWDYDEDISVFIEKQKRSLEYIKTLRKSFPNQAIQNDYIQKNRIYKKKFRLSHLGYIQYSELKLELCGLMKLPNTTSCSCGGGDYEIKRTPLRANDFKENIDTTIDSLLDVISDLKKLKNEIPNADGTNITKESPVKVK